MSMQRRHNKGPSKQYVAKHAPVAGYPGHNDPTEFNQTAKVAQPVPPPAAPVPSVGPMPDLAGQAIAGDGSR